LRPREIGQVLLNLVRTEDADISATHDNKLYMAETIKLGQRVEHSLQVLARIEATYDDAIQTFRQSQQRENSWVADDAVEMVGAVGDHRHTRFVDPEMVSDARLRKVRHSQDDARLPMQDRKF
jgi:hypothetical protein